VQEPIKVLVADDHAVFREGLISVICAESNIEVVAQAATGREVVEKARAHVPDIILMDLFMPEMDGIKATETVMKEAPHTGVIVLTISDNSDHLIRAIRAGAKGYLLKSSEPQTIVDGIKVVYEKGSILSPTIASELLEEIKSIYGEQEYNHRMAAICLTHREIEVLQLVAKGYDNKAIGEALRVSPATVKNHVSNILSKLHLENRIQAAVFAAQHGFAQRKTPQQP
jgi:DNA-binding NarL/FixJ family response regulator